MIEFPFRKSVVILDTNILQNLNSEKLEVKSQFSKLLEDLAKNENSLAFSNYSLLELIEGLNKEKEEKLLKEVLPFGRYIVNESTLLRASRINCLYKKSGNNIKLGDVLIAATAIQGGYFLVTTNGKDFPMPYFREYHREHVFYDGNGRSKGKVIIVNYLYPDLEVINVSLAELSLKTINDPEIISNTPLAHELLAKQIAEAHQALDNTPTAN